MTERVKTPPRRAQRVGARGRLGTRRLAGFPCRVSGLVQLHVIEPKSGLELLGGGIAGQVIMAADVVSSSGEAKIEFRFLGRPEASADDGS